MSTPHRAARSLPVDPGPSTRTVDPEGSTPDRQPGPSTRAGQSRHVDQNWEHLLVTKRTFQPNNRRRHKTHGFRLRMRTRAGRAIVGARRRKGRARLAA
jgi:large subunit ribosomal protein L34